MALGFVLGAAGLPAAAAGLYLLTLAVASFRSPAPRPAPAAWPRLVVLVPAHDEEPLVGRCVASLREQSYPRSGHRIVVIADNCRDRSAATRSTGARDTRSAGPSTGCWPARSRSTASSWWTPTRSPIATR